jgi:hypothetical protein
MTLDSVNRWRSLAGRAAALFCIIFFVSALDGLLSHFRQSPNDLQLLPGESAPINGSVNQDIRDINQLAYAASSDHISVSFTKIHPGYWTGGLMWRGVLVTSPDIASGEYSVSIRAIGEPSEKPMATFRVRVFGDPASLQKSSDSFIQRYTGGSPWWALALCFPLVLLSVGIVYLCSQKREQFLRQAGKAEIYRISTTDGGCEIAFALGMKDGIQVGSLLTLLDKSGMPVGSVKVAEAYEGDSTALTMFDCNVKPGYMVSFKV